VHLTSNFAVHLGLYGYARRLLTDCGINITEKEMKWFGCIRSFGGSAQLVLFIVEGEIGLYGYCCSAFYWWLK